MCKTKVIKMIVIIINHCHGCDLPNANTIGTNLLGRALVQQCLLVSYYKYHPQDNNGLSDIGVSSLNFEDNKIQSDTEAEFWPPDSRIQQNISWVVQFHLDRKSHLSTVYMIWTCLDSSYQRGKHDNRKFRAHQFHFGMFQQDMVLKLERLRHRNGQQGMDSE